MKALTSVVIAQYTISTPAKKLNPVNNPRVPPMLPIFSEILILCD